jgi:hypothetical protein
MSPVMKFIARASMPTLTTKATRNLRRCCRLRHER